MCIAQNNPAHACGIWKMFVLVIYGIHYGFLEEVQFYIVMICLCCV